MYSYIRKIVGCVFTSVRKYSISYWFSLVAWACLIFVVSFILGSDYWSSTVNLHCVWNSFFIDYYTILYTFSTLLTCTEQHISLLYVYSPTVGLFAWKGGKRWSGRRNFVDYKNERLSVEPSVRLFIAYIAAESLMVPFLGAMWYSRVF